MFQIEQNETITSMFTRFTDIINCLKSLGRTYTNSDVVRKILRSLPRTWEAKVTAIQEAKDLNTLSLEELLGSLMTHELMIQQKSEEESKMKKTIALKAISEDEDEESGNEGESDNEVALLTRKFRRFLRRRGPPSKGKSLFKRNQPRDKEKEEEKEVAKVCYNCKKPGHFNFECPSSRREPKKKKAYVATWDDYDSSSDKEENAEVAHLCLMALEDEEQEVSKFEPSDFSDLSHDELVEAFCELMHDSTSLARKLNNMKVMHKNLDEKYNESSIIISSLESENTLLKSKLNEMSSNTDELNEKNILISSLKCQLENINNDMRSLRSENSYLTSRLQNLDDISTTIDNLKAENTELRKTHEDLLKKPSTLEINTQVTSTNHANITDEHSKVKKELEKYKLIVDKFTFSSERLDMLLNNQRAVFNRAGIGYNPTNKQKVVGNLFVNPTMNRQKSTICHCCGKNGHKSYICNERFQTPSSKVVIKTRSNMPVLTKKIKQIWVPKGTNSKNLVASKKTWIPKLT